MRRWAPIALLALGVAFGLWVNWPVIHRHADHVHAKATGQSDPSLPVSE